MGFFFTFLYLLIAFITPLELFGSLAEYHVEILVVFLAVVFSLPNLIQSKILRSRQTFAVLAFSAVIFLSVALTGWLGGAISAFYGFLQTGLAFFLVAINCKRKWHLQAIVLAFVLGSAFFMLLGIRDLYDQVSPSPFLFGEGALRRIRGLGFVHDPNDFAQAMVSLVPAVFLWKRPGFFSNVFLIGLPLTILLVGLYLTHSRGAIVALTAIVLISARRKIGTIPASLLAGLLFAGGLAAGWSGGRDVSMDAGADRLDLWAAGIDIIKAHPLFGVGLGGFADVNGITAHNSVVICAAETGMVGLFFWTMLLFTSLRDGARFDAAATKILPGGVADVSRMTSSPVSPPQRHHVRSAVFSKRSAIFARQPLRNVASSAAISKPDHVMFSRTAGDGDPGAISSSLKKRIPVRHPMAVSVTNLSALEVRSIIRLLVASLTGFLTAGWFLSRATSIWLFMYCGMLYAACQMGTEAGIVPPEESLASSLGWSFAVTLGLIMLISIILRLRNIGH